MFIRQPRNLWFTRTAVGFALTAFFVTTAAPQAVMAQVVSSSLPEPGEKVELSEEFNPPILVGIKINPADALQINFLFDVGDSELDNEQVTVESQKLIKYFLAALTIPDDEVWVNLSPYEQDMVIPDNLGMTELGKDMLAQDYLLKQITASLTHPEEKLGKKFWKQVYQKAFDMFGTTEIPVNTFNKVWVVPGQASVLEKDGSVIVAESDLKVMMEQDYLAIEKNLNNKELGLDQMDVDKVSNINTFSSEVVRDVIIPELEKEVNRGRNFALIRQVYNSVVLATWYKKSLRESLLSKIYVDKNKIAGVNADDPQVKQKIYSHYMAAFREGVYNMIKDEFDTGSKNSYTRRYFSGGFNMGALAQQLTGVSQVEQLRPAGQRRTAEINDAVRSGSGRILEIQTGFRTPRESDLQANTAFAVSTPEEANRLQSVIMGSIPDSGKHARMRQDVQTLVRAAYEDRNTVLEPDFIGRRAPLLAQEMENNPRLAEAVRDLGRHDLFPKVERVAPETRALQAAAMGGGELIGQAISRLPAAQRTDIDTSRLQSQADRLRQEVARTPGAASSPAQINAIAQRVAPDLQRLASNNTDLQSNLGNALPVPVQAQPGRVDTDRALQSVAVGGAGLVGAIIDQLPPAERRGLDTDTVRFQANSFRQAVASAGSDAANDAGRLREIAQASAPDLFRAASENPAFRSNLSASIPEPVRVNTDQVDAVRALQAASVGGGDLVGDIVSRIPQENRPGIDASQLQGQAEQFRRKVTEAGPAVRNDPIKILDIARTSAPDLLDAAMNSPQVRADLGRALPDTGPADSGQAQVARALQAVAVGGGNLVVNVANNIPEASRPNTTNIDTLHRQADSFRQALAAQPGAVNDAGRVLEIARNSAPTLFSAAQSSDALRSGLSRSLPEPAAAGESSSPVRALQALALGGGDLFRDTVTNIPASERQGADNDNLPALADRFRQAVNAEPGAVNNPERLSAIAQTSAPDLVRAAAIPAVQSGLSRAVPQAVTFSPERQDATRALQAVALGGGDLVGQVVGQIPEANRQGLNLGQLRVQANTFRQAVQAAAPEIRNDANGLNDLAQRVAPQLARVATENSAVRENLVSILPEPARLDPNSQTRTRALQAASVGGGELVQRIASAIPENDRGGVDISSLQTQANNLRSAVQAAGPAARNDEIQLRRIAERNAPDLARFVAASPTFSANLGNTLPQRVNADTGSIEAARALQAAAVGGQDLVGQVLTGLPEASRPDAAQTGRLREQAVSFQQAIRAAGPAAINDENQIREIAQRTAPDLSGFLRQNSDARSTLARALPDASQSPSRNRANEPVGGIDFNVAMMNLEIKRDGNGVPLPVNMQDLDNIDIDGLFPVILDVKPANMDALPISG